MKTNKQEGKSISLCIIRLSAIFFVCVLLSDNNGSRAPLLPSKTKRFFFFLFSVYSDKLNAGGATLYKML